MNAVIETVQLITGGWTARIDGVLLRRKNSRLVRVFSSEQKAIRAARAVSIE